MEAATETTETTETEVDQEAAKEAAKIIAGDDKPMRIPKAGAWPEWCPPMPGNLKIPRGRFAFPMRFREQWTDATWKGDRTCVVWSLSPGDEKLAYARARGDSARGASELAKQMIRVVDGLPATDVHGQPGCVDDFWAEIGGKCRQMLIRWYVQTHVLSDREQDDFFENCVAAVTGT
jgi:hypothetical protein